MSVKDNEHAITILQEITDKLSRILLGSNGGPGMSENVRETNRRLDSVERGLGDLDKRLGAVESDSRETLTMVREIVGYSGVRHDKENHPHRREGDKERINKLSNKIRPFLLDVSKVVVAALLVWLLSDIFPRIFLLTGVP